MALPSSGQISFNDVRTEMSQSFNNYDIFSWSWGYLGDTIFTPINVHTDQDEKYGVTDMNTWHSYDRTKNYASDGTTRTLFDPIYFGSTMILFDLGTTNTTWDITLSASLADCSVLQSITCYYGKPWQQNGNGRGNATQVYFQNNIYNTGVNTTVNYNYTYDSNKGQYLYIMLTGAAL